MAAKTKTIFYWRINILIFGNYPDFEMKLYGDINLKKNKNLSGSLDLNNIGLSSGSGGGFFNSK